MTIQNVIKWNVGKNAFDHKWMNGRNNEHVVATTKVGLSRLRVFTNLYSFICGVSGESYGHKLCGLSSALKARVPIVNLMRSMHFSNLMSSR